MERFWTWVAYLATVIAVWWWGLHSAYRLLFIFQGLDILLGVVAAISKREFRSNIGIAGIVRRLATWIFVLGVAVLQKEAGIFFESVAIIQGIGIAEGAAYVAAFFEFSSIIENCQRMGVKIPRWFIDALKRAEKTLGLMPEEREKK